MEKILVTGATGFIGDYVIDELLRRGVNIIASSSSEANASGKTWFSKVDYRALDFSNYRSSVNYYDYFGRPDRMIHLAWEGLPHYKEDFHMTENLPRHSWLLNNMITNGLKDITVTGTCLEYGMREGRLKEDMACEPELSYAKAKYALYRTLSKTVEESNANLKWIRLFYMYGKGQNPQSLFSQLDRAIARGDKSFNMSPGEQVRDFLPVEQVSKNIVAIAVQNKVIGIINCCSGQPVTVRAFVQEYLDKQQAGMHLNLGFYGYTDYEPMAFWGDTVKLNQALNQIS